MIRFSVDDQTGGLLHLKDERPGSFTKEDVEFYEGIAQTFGLAAADRRASAAVAGDEVLCRSPTLRNGRCCDAQPRHYNSRGAAQQGIPVPVSGKDHMAGIA